MTSKSSNKVPDVSVNATPTNPVPLIQQDLYFGLDIPGEGKLSDAEFQAFLDKVIAPRFFGLTKFNVKGQVKDANGKINKENSRLVTIITEDTPANKTAIAEVRATYSQQFNGKGSLQVTNADDLKINFGPAADLFDNSATPKLIEVDAYFGRNIPGDGEVSQKQFQKFIDNVLAPSVPGLTIFKAQGQVRSANGSITKENSQVVKLILEDTLANETALSNALKTYQQKFNGAGELIVANQDVKVSFGAAADLFDNSATPKFIQADLYFGQNAPGGGSISKNAFQKFVDREIAPRFPGLTQFDAKGEVKNAAGKIVKEDSQVIRLILQDTLANEKAINDVLNAYKTKFGGGTLAVFDQDITASFSTGQTSNLTSDQLVSFELQDVLIPAQSAIADVSVNLDYKPGLDNSQFRDIIPVAKFVKDKLANSKNPNEFYEIINKNLATSLLNNRSFDLKSVLEEASITLDVAPNANIPFAFSTTVAIAPNGKTDALVSFELQDVLIPAQSAVADVSVNLDYKPGVNNNQFRNILPVAEFVKDKLTNSQNPGEFYEIINKNLATSLLNNRSFDLKSVLEEASITLDVAPNANIPFAFSTTVAIAPNGKTDALVSFELQDVLIPAQSAVADVSVNLDYKPGVNNNQFRNILPVAEFVKDKLTNSQNPGEFYEIINKNLATSLLNNNSFDLKSVLEEASITLDVAPNANIPFAFSNTVKITTDGKTDELVSFELKDVLIPAQSGIANVTVDLDYKAGVDDSEFRDIIPVAKFVKDSLMNSKNPNEFYEIINRNVAEHTFSNLGLASVLDSLTITLGVEPNSGIPFPFTDTVTVTANGITQSHGII
ncbi:hypothetical protein NIES2100_18590 [Calothrix sp. NIES-2100]|uniref:DUF3574 domain-containing protein n=1 Tax=Calothrix sp. NIES-2100 TaxID=1954172 RepID=UPI000B5E5A90|nr:hypothetical protein NIES2100_18590 [Calothrix sp. NIES-2100]